LSHFSFDFGRRSTMHTPVFDIKVAFRKTQLRDTGRGMRRILGRVSRCAPKKGCVPETQPASYGPHLGRSGMGNVRSRLIWPRRHSTVTMFSAIPCFIQRFYIVISSSQRYCNHTEWQSNDTLMIDMQWLVIDITSKFCIHVVIVESHSLRE
jgi:hypothetical protein